MKNYLKYFCLKKIILIIFLSVNVQFCLGQNPKNWESKIDSLHTLLKNPNFSETHKIRATFELLEVFTNLGWLMTNVGEFAKAYESFGSAFEICEDLKLIALMDKHKNIENFEKAYWNKVANLNFNYGHLMKVTGNYGQQQYYYQKAYQIASKWNDKLNMVFSLSGMAFLYLRNNKLDSAVMNMDKINLFQTDLHNFESYSDLMFIQGLIKLEIKEIETAKNLFYKGLQDALDKRYVVGRAANYLGLSKAYMYLNQRDSSIHYAKKTLQILTRIREIQMFDIDLSTAYVNLFQHFEYFNQPDSGYIYLQLAYKSKETFTNQNKVNLAAFQQVFLERERTINILQKEKLDLQNKFKTYFFLTLLAVLGVLVLIFMRGNSIKQKANLVLVEQKEEINIQKEKVEIALISLKSAQAQLIQSEKLASLGELTAGIAHEIQNPLNFVNNFSEISNELIVEMNEELDKGDIEEAKGISADIKSNLEKINHHGKRASDIVKGMLEHSRMSTGQKESTDINALCDEYLRLAYHGLKAKNKDFNTTMETHYYSNLPKIEVIPQDIGRVLLNLINNAFYAVSEKSKVESQKSGSDYESKVTITTQLTANSQLLIAVKDNGSGIPDAIKEKIFQPFFTTKPTGQGTGLGLSLSYDIVKAHGGELTLISNVGVGTEFKIKIPII